MNWIKLGLTILLCLSVTACQSNSEEENPELNMEIVAGQEVISNEYSQNFESYQIESQYQDCLIEISQDALTGNESFSYQRLSSGDTSEYFSF